MRVNVPGKVFIMGEYTVIDRQSGALIAPTKARLSVTITQSDVWQYESALDGFFKAHSWDVFSTQMPSKIIRSVLPYIQSIDRNNQLITPFRLRIDSQLDDGKVPYGLGSSGALRAGVIKAFFAYFNMPLDALLIFQMAALSSASETSSYGDLAVSSFDQAIHYQKPKTLDPLSHMVVDPVGLPPFIIVHTGLKVSSTPFIKRYMANRDDPFIQTYKDQINDALEGFKEASISDQLARIKASHIAYLQMSETLDPSMVPDHFIPIFTAIEATGGTPKVSGAGGGDTILAFYPDQRTLEYAQAQLNMHYPLFLSAR